MIDKIIDLLDGLNGEELERLPPARRQKFAALCHHWWQLAEPPPKEPKASIEVLHREPDGLTALVTRKSGERGE